MAGCLRHRAGAPSIVALLALVACASHGDGLLVGRDGTGGTGSGAPGAGGAPGVIPGSNAGRAGATSVHAPQDHVRVEFVTLTCAGACADVEAVANGGQPPYTFSWEDGSANPKRRVCPASSTNYVVRVTDSGVPSGEFTRPPETASAPLTAQVLACPQPASDSGAPDSGAGEQPVSAGLCVPNPSFEGAPYPVATPEWIVCQGTANVCPGLTSYPASDGTTYMGLISNANASLSGTIEADLCTPLRAGRSIPVALELSMSGAFGPFGNSYFQLWGASASCVPEELLWTSPLLTAYDTWKTYCATLTPSKDFRYLMALPSVSSSEAGAPTASGGFLIVDHFRTPSASTCL